MIDNFVILQKILINQVAIRSQPNKTFPLLLLIGGLFIPGYIPISESLITLSPNPNKFITINPIAPTDATPTPAANIGTVTLFYS